MGNCNITPIPLIEVGDYEFNPNEVIGAGHHGVLFQGSPKNDRLFEIAVKQVNHTFDPNSFPKIESILQKLMSVSHENLTHYIDYYYNDKEAKLYIMIEFCAHGSLHDLIQNQPKFNPLRSLKTSLSYCKQIINGIIALHHKEIIHENLRPQNILIHYDTLKISDFGMTELERLSIT